MASPLPSLRQGHAHGKTGVGLPVEGGGRRQDAPRIERAAPGTAAPLPGAPQARALWRLSPSDVQPVTAVRGVTRHRAKLTRGGAARTNEGRPRTGVGRAARRDHRGIGPPSDSAARAESQRRPRPLTIDRRGRPAPSSLRLVRPRTLPNRPTRLAGRADVDSPPGRCGRAQTRRSRSALSLLCWSAGVTPRARARASTPGRARESVESSRGGAPRRGRSARGRPGSLGFERAVCLQGMRVDGRSSLRRSRSVRPRSPA